jgi:O-antigen ligase
VSTPAKPETTSRGISLATVAHHVFLASLALVTVFVTVFSASPVLAVLPILLVTGLFVVAKTPLRWSTLGFVFLLLVPDDTTEAVFGQWRTPFALVGDVVHFRLDAVLNIPGLAVTGMELLALFLFAVWIHGRYAGTRLEEKDRVRAASSVRAFLLIYAAGVLLSDLFGLARGLPVAPWKVRNLLHVPMLAALFLVAFRDINDHMRVGRLVVAAACARSVLAIVVQRLAIAETGGRYACATSHGDSLLLAAGLLLVLVDLLERPSRRRLVRAALLLPLIILGGVENQRRIFWVMVAMSLGSVYLLSPMKGWKLALTRFCVVAFPVLALYIGAGWNRASGLFAPVSTLRSVVDSSTDRSAYWREVENWNIAVSMRQLPITGLGLGGEYTEVMANDSVADGYREYREWPHNTFLGLLLLMGLFGFTAVFALSSLVVFLSIRSYRLATAPQERVAALGCLGTIVAAQVLAWGDTGAHYPHFKVLVALAVAVSASLAAATGAWRNAGAQATPSWTPGP